MVVPSQQKTPRHGDVAVARRGPLRHDRPKKRHHGFTLLEILIAFSIMAFSLAALYKASGNNVQQLTRAQVQIRAASLAHSLMALRDTVPASGWSASGVSAEFQWVIASSRYTGPLDLPDTKPDSNTGTAGLPGGPALVPLHQVEYTIEWREDTGVRQLKWRTLLPETIQPAQAEPT